MDGSTMLAEFDHEFAETREALERVPEDRFDWKPHEKSFSLQHLAAHIAEIPKWMSVAIEEDGYDMDGSYEPDVPETKDGILDAFDTAVEQARSVLGKATAEQLMGTWTMSQNGEAMMSMPKAAVLRSFILNHNVHHRAQLGVYLRMLDIPVPSHYGPSADEAG